MTELSNADQAPIRPARWYDGLNAEAISQRFQENYARSSNYRQENGVFAYEFPSGRELVIPSELERVGILSPGKIVKDFYEPVHIRGYPTNSFSSATSLTTNYDAAGSLDSFTLVKSKEYITSALVPSERTTLNFRADNSLKLEVQKLRSDEIDPNLEEDTLVRSDYFEITYDEDRQFRSAELRGGTGVNMKFSLNATQINEQMKKAEPNEDIQFDLSPRQPWGYWKAKMERPTGLVTVIRVVNNSVTSDDDSENTEGGELIAKFPRILKVKPAEIADKLLPTEIFGNFDEAKKAYGGDDDSWKNAYPPTLMQVSFTHPKVYTAARVADEAA